MGKRNVANSSTINWHLYLQCFILVCFPFPCWCGQLLPCSFQHPDSSHSECHDFRAWHIFLGFSHSPRENGQILGNSQDFSGTWPPKDSSRPFPQCHSHVAVVVRSSLLEQTTPVGLKVSDTAPEITNIQFSDQDPAVVMGRDISGVGGVEMCRTATTHEILKFLGFKKL